MLLKYQAWVLSFRWSTCFVSFLKFVTLNAPPLYPVPQVWTSYFRRMEIIVKSSPASSVLLAWRWFATWLVTSLDFIWFFKLLVISCQMFNMRIVWPKGTLVLTNLYHLTKPLFQLLVMRILLDIERLYQSRKRKPIRLHFCWSWGRGFRCSRIASTRTPADL